MVFYKIKSAFPNRDGESTFKYANNSVKARVANEKQLYLTYPFAAAKGLTVTHSRGF